VYVPAPRDLYPADFSTYVVPEGPARAYEGASRPGHFRGVATVVTKLLQRTRPDLACFGCKDAQQVAVVERLVRDLDLSGRVVVGPTIRDPDGLALSSRNRYLDGAARARALALPRALGAIVDAAARVVTSRDALATAGRAVLDDARVRVDYLDVVDAATFEPVEQLARPALAIGALWVDDVHLIDNEWIAPPA
jgi:pantoate--beta-alanine ligase